MIRIGSIKAGDSGEYCGRACRGRKGSPLSNPFPLKNESDRDGVCDLYQSWFSEQLRLRSPLFISELDRLERIAREGDLVLLCWCRDVAGTVNKRCHAESIRSELERRISSTSK